MQINNLIEHRIIGSSTYVIDNFTITFDAVQDLGNFLEIEYMAPDTNDINDIKIRMEALVKNLTIKRLTTGYDTLILRKQNFDLYLQSRFILEEDKI